MKLNNLLLVTFGCLLFFSISSMEEVEPIEHEAEEIELTEKKAKEPTFQKVLRPAKIPSLIKIVSKKVLGAIAEKAVENYNKVKSENPNQAYKAFSEYLYNSEERSKLPEESFYNIIYDYITFDLGRVDIFAKHLLDMFRNKETEQNLIGFFNQFNEDIKIDLTIWLIEELSDMHYFDSIDPEFETKINEDGEHVNIYKNVIVDLLTSIIKNDQSINFYDIILKSLNEELEKTKTFTFKLNTDSERDKDLFSEWNENGELEINLLGYWSSEEDQKIRDNFYSSVLSKIFISRNFIAHKINTLKNLIQTILTKSINHYETVYREDLEEIGINLLSLFEKYDQANISEQIENKKKLSELIDKYNKNLLNEVIDYLFNTHFLKNDNKIDVLKFIKFVYPNDIERNNQFIRIFEMLDKKYPEYVRISYKKHLGALEPKIKLISNIQESARNIPANKLKELLVTNEEHQNNEKIIYELNYYYRLLGFDFIDELVTFMIDKSFNFEQPSTQIAILNNLHDLILKFSDLHDIDKTEFTSEIEEIDYKIKEINKLEQ